MYDSVNRLEPTFNGGAASADGTQRAAATAMSTVAQHEFTKEPSRMMGHLRIDCILASPIARSRPPGLRRGVG